MAPVELISFAGRKAHRHKSLHWNTRPFVPPNLHKAMHAVVGAVISLPAQLLKQPLGRSPLAMRQLGFLLQYAGQNRDPFAQLRHRLHQTLILELGLLSADHLAHRGARYRQQPHDLLDRTPLLEIGASYLANQIHANHPPIASKAATAQGRKLPHVQKRGLELEAKTALQGVTIASEFTICDRICAQPCISSFRSTDQGSLE